MPNIPDPLLLGETDKSTWTHMSYPFHTDKISGWGQTRSLEIMLGSSICIQKANFSLKLFLRCMKSAIIDHSISFFLSFSYLGSSFHKFKRLCGIIQYECQFDNINTTAGIKVRPNTRVDWLVIYLFLLFSNWN